jgi:hypothetical protein
MRTESDQVHCRALCIGEDALDSRALLEHDGRHLKIASLQTAGHALNVGLRSLPVSFGVNVGITVQADTSFMAAVADHYFQQRVLGLCELAQRDREGQDLHTAIGFIQRNKNVAEQPSFLIKTHGLLCRYEQNGSLRLSNERTRSTAIDGTLEATVAVTGHYNQIAFGSRVVSDAVGDAAVHYRRKEARVGAAPHALLQVFEVRFGLEARR